MSDLTKTISDFSANLLIQNIPTHVLETTKLFVADYFASCIAGYGLNKHLNESVMDIIRFDSGSEQATILFEKQKYPTCIAAYANAIYAHGADFDDGNRKSAGHVGAHVMSAVFALAEGLNVTWGDVLVAINVGYEVFNRVVSATMPSMYNKGFHSTGVGGAIASAAAGAKLLKLDSEGIYNAISLAAVQSGGLIIIDESGQECKPINAANATRIGVHSALLASKKIKAPDNPLESSKGWFNAFADNVDINSVTEKLGKTFTISESYLKCYPTCRHTHCSMDVALELRRNILEKKEKLNNIKRIKVFVYSAAIKSTGNISIPKTPAEAKFSITYCVAKILEKGRFGVSELFCEFTDFIDLTIPKIILIHDETLEDRSKGIRGSRIEIEMQSGQIFIESALIPKGEATKPLIWDDMYKKMTNCSMGNLNDSVCNALLKDIKLIDIKKTFMYPMNDL